MIPGYRSTRAWFRNRVLWRAPAGVDCVADPVIGQPIGQRDKDFSCRGFVRLGFVGCGLGGSFFREAETAELFSNALDG